MNDFLLIQDQFLTLLSFMPYLKTIEFDKYDRNKLTYLQYLDSMLEKRNNSSNVDGNSSNDSVQPLDRLQEIRCDFCDPRPDADTIKEVFKACYALRNSLTHLYFCRLQIKLAVGNQTGTYMNFLPHFQCLAHLTIENKRYSYYGTVGNPNLSFKAIFTACPNLINLKLWSSYPVIQQHDEGLDANSTDIRHSTLPVSGTTATNVDTSINEERASTATLTIYHYLSANRQQGSINSYCPRLKSISLNTPSLNISQFVKYYTSSSLEELNLEINRQEFGVWAREPNNDDLVQFGNLLGSLKVNCVYLQHTC